MKEEPLKITIPAFELDIMKELLNGILRPEVPFKRDRLQMADSVVEQDQKHATTILAIVEQYYPSKEVQP